MHRPLRVVVNATFGPPGGGKTRQEGNRRGATGQERREDGHRHDDQQSGGSHPRRAAPDVHTRWTLPRAKRLHCRPRSSRMVPTGAASDLDPAAGPSPRRCPGLVRHLPAQALPE